MLDLFRLIFRPQAIQAVATLNVGSYIETESEKQNCYLQPIVTTGFFTQVENILGS